MSPTPTAAMSKTAIFACVALSGLATAVIMPILAPLMRELGLTESQAGWMVSIGSISMALIAGLWGRISDRTGRKPVILIGFAGLCVSYVAFTLVVWMGLNGLIAGSMLLALLFAARAAVGAFLPAVSASAQALMADMTSDAERSAGMATISAASGLGMVVGPAIGGVLALYGLILPLVLTSTLCLVALLAARVSLPSPPPRTASASTRVNLLDPDLWPWLIAGFVGMVSIVTMQIAAGFYFQDRLGLSSEETAPMLAVALTLVGLALLVTQIVQIRILRWAPRTMILIGAPLWVIGLSLMLHTAAPLLYYVSYALLGAGAGLMLPGFLSGASLAVSPGRQGALAGIAAATQGLGAIVAPVISTSLYEIDPGLPFWLVIGLMLSTGLLFIVRRPRPFLAISDAVPAG